MDDLWFFGRAIAGQYLHCHPAETPVDDSPGEMVLSEPTWRRIRAPGWFNAETLARNSEMWREAQRHHCVLELSGVQHIDSTGIGLLLALEKRLTARGSHLVLMDPSPTVRKVLKCLRLEHHFLTASDIFTARELLDRNGHVPASIQPENGFHATLPLIWSGEITAANEPEYWRRIEQEIRSWAEITDIIPADLAELRFIDSTGIGVLLRARKLAQKLGVTLQLRGAIGPVLDILRVSRMDWLLD